MIDVWTTEFPAVTGEKTRKVYVYLPTSYEKDNEKRYPVLYMFDGHNVFFDSPHMEKAGAWENIWTIRIRK